MRLKGETAFVTGAGKGIGAEIARVLAREGATVAVTARRRAAAEDVAAEIVAGGGKAKAFGCDVSDAGSVDAAFAASRNEIGDIGILVNNAGIIEPLGAFHEAEPAAWAENVSVNLVGAAAAARAALPGMLAAGKGVIVNISSGAARIPIAGWGAYCAAKAGLAMLTQILAAEYGERGVRVFGFAPGLIDTDMQGQIRASGVGPIARLPREKLASPRQPALAVAFLASAEGARFAGQEVDARNPDFRAAAGLPALPA